MEAIRNFRSYWKFKRFKREELTIKRTNNAKGITRKGDIFTYTRTQGEEPQKIDLLDVFRAAATTQDVQTNIVAALAFLENCFTLFAGAGEDLDEYQAVGLAAICRALTDSADDAYNSQYRENQIIKALAAGDV